MCICIYMDISIYVSVYMCMYGYIDMQYLHSIVLVNATGTWSCYNACCSHKNYTIQAVKCNCLLGTHILLSSYNAPSIGILFCMLGIRI